MITKRLPASVTVQQFLSSYVKDKTVLDVGCVDHNPSSETLNTWLHRHLVHSATSVIGLDILQSHVEELRKRGYDMICGDATSILLDRKFDVIVAGEFIEHIGSPGPFISNMVHHLNENGRLVITTPHAFFLLHAIERWFSLEEKRWNEEHVSWYCPFTLANLLKSNGWEVENIYFATRSKILRRILRVLHLPCFGFLSSTIIAVAKLPARTAPEESHNRRSDFQCNVSQLESR